MANKKILLKSTGGDALYPRTSIDNLVDAVGSTVSVSVPVLDANGKLDSSYLPSYVDDIVDLLAITGTAPTSCAAGDMYFNSTSGNLKIYTATAANTWGTTGTTPETGKIYVNLADSKIYRWSGSAMVEISKQISTVTSVRATSSALDTVVPTEKAVATALSGKAASSHTHSISNVTNLQTTLDGKANSSHSHEISDVSGLQTALDGKQGTLTPGSNISISNGTISNTYAYSLPAATTSARGGVVVSTTASNGVALAISSGTVSVAATLATTTAAGTVRLATTTEATTGTSEAVAVTPKGLKTELDKKAEGAGHGGSDFFVTYNFVQDLIHKRQPVMNVYRAVAMSAVGILGWRSALNNSVQLDIPDFSKKEDRDRVRDDVEAPQPHFGQEGHLPRKIHILD